jgi:hypothetical protein
LIQFDASSFKAAVFVKRVEFQIFGAGAQVGELEGSVTEAEAEWVNGSPLKYT